MFDDSIAKWSGVFGIPQAWIRGVIAVESSWNPNAVSPVGAIGLMQVMPATGKLFGVDDPATLYDPDVNIKTGTAVLAENRSRLGDDLPRILSQYNSGRPDLYLTNQGVAAYVTKVITKIEGYLASDPFVESTGAGVLIVFVLMWFWAKSRNGSRKGKKIT